MAVSWYSPSAVLTPGGVASGLSDIAEVIASAPERKARIESQIAAEQRANREMAIRELSEQRAMQDADRRAKEFEAQQRQREVELAGMTGVTTSQDPQAIARAKIAAAKLAQDKQEFDRQQQEQALQRTITLDNRDATMFTNARKGYISQGTGGMLRPDLVAQQRKYLEDEQRAKDQEYLEQVSKGMADPNKASMAIWPQAQMQAINYGLAQNMNRQEQQAKIEDIQSKAAARQAKAERDGKVQAMDPLKRIKYTSTLRRAENLEEELNKAEEMLSYVQDGDAQRPAFEQRATALRAMWEKANLEAENIFNGGESKQPEQKMTLSQLRSQDARYATVPEDKLRQAAAARGITITD